MSEEKELQRGIIIIGAGSSGLSPTIIQTLKAKYGDVPIITADEAREKGLLAFPEASRTLNEYTLECLPSLAQPYVDEPRNNKPWYDQFSKKRNKNKKRR